MTSSKTKFVANSASSQPNSPDTNLPVHQLALHALEAAFSKKAYDVVVMDMREVSGIADLFILCTGASDLQIKAIVQAIRERIREHGNERPWHVEGTENHQWVLLDYVNLVIHVFTEEKRAFYDLERLWGDAPKENVSEEVILNSLSILQPS